MQSIADALPKVKKVAEVKQQSIDIGTYDGGFENEDDMPNRDIPISRESLKLLELDSSISG